MAESFAKGFSNQSGFSLWDKPSTNDVDYWIFYDTPNLQVDGKWMIFCDRMKPGPDGLISLYRTWKTLCDKHMKFSFYPMKVSTRKPSQYASSKTGVIIVYTKTSDRIDILRELKKVIPLPGKLSWKIDIDTFWEIMDQIRITLPSIVMRLINNYFHFNCYSLESESIKPELMVQLAIKTEFISTHLSYTPRGGASLGLGGLKPPK